VIIPKYYCTLGKAGNWWHCFPCGYRL